MLRRITSDCDGCARWLRAIDLNFCSHPRFNGDQWNAVYAAVLACVLKVCRSTGPVEHIHSRRVFVVLWVYFFSTVVVWISECVAMFSGRSISIIVWWPNDAATATCGLGKIEFTLKILNILKDRKDMNWFSLAVDCVLYSYHRIFLELCNCWHVPDSPVGER